MPVLKIANGTVYDPANQIADIFESVIEQQSPATPDVEMVSPAEATPAAESESEADVAAGPEPSPQDHSELECIP